MKVAVSAPDHFVAPYIVEMLGKSAVAIPPEILKDQLSLDALLTSCTALIHINSSFFNISFSNSMRWICFLSSRISICSGVIGEADGVWPFRSCFN